MPFFFQPLFFRSFFPFFGNVSVPFIRDLMIEVINIMSLRFHSLEFVFDCLKQNLNSIQSSDHEIISS